MPGTSGILSPFGKIDGLYFNDSREPDGYMFDFKQDIRDIMKNENVDYIEIKMDNKEDYYKMLDSLSNFNKDCITVNGTSKDLYTIVVEEPEDIDSDEPKRKRKKGEE